MPSAAATPPAGRGCEILTLSGFADNAQEKRLGTFYATADDIEGRPVYANRATGDYLYYYPQKEWWLAERRERSNLHGFDRGGTIRPQVFKGFKRAESSSGPALHLVRGSRGTVRRKCQQPTKKHRLFTTPGTPAPQNRARRRRRHSRG